MWNNKKSVLKLLIHWSLLVLCVMLFGIATTGGSSINCLKSPEENANFGYRKCRKGGGAACDVTYRSIIHDHAVKCQFINGKRNSAPSSNSMAFSNLQLSLEPPATTTTSTKTWLSFLHQLAWEQFLERHNIQEFEITNTRTTSNEPFYTLEYDRRLF